MTTISRQRMRKGWPIGAKAIASSAVSFAILLSMTWSFVGLYRAVLQPRFTFASHQSATALSEQESVTTSFPSSSANFTNSYGYTANGDAWFEKVFGGVSTINAIPKSMMSLHGGKLLWCPNAKVGTTSLYHLIFGSVKVGSDNRRCFDSCEYSAWKVFENETQRQIMTQNAISFTIVRNPWDRVMSFYKDRIVADKKIPKQLRGKQNVSFVDVVSHIEQYPTGHDIHWMPFYSRCLTSPNEDGRMFHYDHVLRLEDGIWTGLQKVFTDANLPELVKLVSNKTTDTVGANSYTQHTVSARHDFYKQAARDGGMSMEDLVLKVGRIYQKDIERHGYSFDKYN